MPSNSPSNVPFELTQWLNELSLSETKDSKKNVPHQLNYILGFSTYYKTQELLVAVHVQRILKNGGLGKSKKTRIDSTTLLKHANNEDRGIIAELRLNNDFELSKLKTDQLINNIIATNRCFLNEEFEEPLTLGEEITGTFEWLANQNGDQALQLVCQLENYRFYLADSLWYIALNENKIGKIKTGLTAQVTKTLLQAPTIKPINSTIAKEIMEEKIPSHTNLHPKKLSLKKKTTPSKIIPIIQFNHTKTKIETPWYEDYAEENHTPTATLYMSYDNQRINILEQTRVLSVLDKKNVLEIQRDLKKESAYLKELIEKLEIAPIYELEDLTACEHKENDRWVIFELLEKNEPEDYFLFKHAITDKLKKSHWKIEFDGHEYEDIIEIDDSQWYSGLESSDNNFFKLELGVEINNQKIDIMPTLIKLLNKYDPKELLEQPDDKTFITRLNSGDKVALPFGRIKPMIKTIVALFNVQKLKPNQELTLSKAHAALMYEMQKAHQSCKLRWHGNKELSILGEKLSQLTSIEEVKAPKKFKAKLRSYQQDGLNWLQFLREYQLSGILADDMGLGKTVQTLAHLCVEKSKKRLTSPCLIVAPTSLMTNWQQETEKFAPHLSYLVFHGDKRHLLKNDFNKVDLIFTTYDLVTRDKDLFLDHKFYYIILDEAQRIKNAKAKSTQIILQLNTQHRLCLSGTPMENHLGELWSLFHFLMPGFLGDMKSFTELFKTPIEKHNDLEVRQRLGKRLKPFLLRRLKSDVIQELPDKTEIIRHVELTSKQRDIYESIRLTMEAKIQKAILNKGVSRSHIEILEALLRLRQTCCDPRLLKLDNIEHCNSQKLEDLMALLSTLMEEGRSVLLFSQFTSMLTLIEEELLKSKINYVKLTGQTKDRKSVIEKFQNGESKLFLISLKAGGVGLNLTQADTVIHYDPWWNPAVEDQATDRSHRIGQKKAVFVYKFIAKGTVEETINQMQQKKRGLIKGLFDAKAGAKLSLSQEDLSNLLKPIDVK